jgi:hypothetical protein
MEKPKVVGMISKILFKFYIYLKEKFDPRYPTTEEEIYCSNICLTLIDSSDSYLTISPISNKRFIKNENKEIFVIINNREITLINHVYGYNLMMEDENMYQNIIQKFDLTLEQKRQKFENEMRDNVRHSLKTILEKIS